MSFKCDKAMTNRKKRGLETSDFGMHKIKSLSLLPKPDNSLRQNYMISNEHNIILVWRHNKTWLQDTCSHKED